MRKAAFMQGECGKWGKGPRQSLGKHQHFRGRRGRRLWAEHATEQQQGQRRTGKDLPWRKHQGRTSQQDQRHECFPMRQIIENIHWTKWVNCQYSWSSNCQYYWSFVMDTWKFITLSQLSCTFEIVHISKVIFLSIHWTNNKEITGELGNCIVFGGRRNPIPVTEDFLIPDSGLTGMPVSNHWAHTPQVFLGKEKIVCDSH